jgi:hypothetical protein
LDGDGKLDVVTSGHGVTKIWKQVSPTSFSSRTITSLTGGGGVFLGDIDGDGRPDIAVPSGWLKTPAAPTSILTGTFTKTNIAGTGDLEEVAIADFNHDGKPDIVMSMAHDRSNVYIVFNPGTPTNTNWTKVVIDPSMGAHKIEIADFNGDSWPDILLGLERQEISVYINQGNNGFVKTVVDTTAAHNARAGDGHIFLSNCSYNIGIQLAS